MTLPTSAVASAARVPRSRHRGFTLIELMIVIAIIGVLASLAYPSYTRYVRRGQRTGAQVALNEAAQFMQRFYSANNAYDRKLGDTGKTVTDTALLPASLQNAPKDSANPTYTIKVVTDRFTYTLTAERKTGTMMASDECGDFKLTNTGLKGLTNQATGQTVATCWR